ncbi:ABC-three component system protein [Celeribacter halophilus]|uniref:ABC-three component system protein n=1 Tax=Celeribacter halophilus TaxID=576117 RepID=UPI003A95C7E3
MSPEQFENLVTALGQELFGLAVQGFATGPDGGRDAKFEGTAERFPNAAHPWTGITIFQAKHTNGHNRVFSESDFFNTNNNECTVEKEIPRIKKLKDNGKLDNYFLVANRRLPANAEDKIKDRIQEKTGLDRKFIYLCGIEQLELWLKRFPTIVMAADLDPIDAPLIVNPEQLAEIVEAFVDSKDELMAAIDNTPTTRTSYAKKNEINGMTPSFANALQRNYLKDTKTIARFFSDPENQRYCELYDEVAEEFNLKVAAKRKHYQSFDDVFNYLADILFQRDPILRQVGKKRITRSILFYMYWQCDLGETESA